MTGRARWLLLCTLGACAPSCDDPERLAELAARTGAEVERDEARAPGAWRRAELGARFHVGDSLRTGARSSAELALSPSGTAHVSPHSLVRFLAAAPSRPSGQVALETGEVEVLAEQIDLEIHTPLAVAQVTRGSKLKLSTRADGERFDLVIGRVLVAHAGVQRALEPAHPLELRAGRNERAPATSEPDANTPPGDASAPAEEGDAAAPPDATRAAADAGGPARAAANPASALRLSALESATLHVGSSPIDVLLPGNECNGAGVLRVDGRALALGASGVTAQLGPGSHTLNLTCADGARRAARLVVKRDPAQLELPRRAQRVRVEADGRRYTVRYQNLLPDLTFVWPGEPERGDYTLTVHSGKRELTRSLGQPEHLLSGGVLGEGEHKFWFRDAQGRSSQPTTLRLAFDNTARSAYLSQPAEGSELVGGSVVVEGAALVASKVSVEGKSVKLDEQGRFREQALLAPEQKAVSVRVEHPASGIHYYVRRLR